MIKTNKSSKKMNDRLNKLKIVLPDVLSSSPLIQLSIDKVGVKDVKKWIKLKYNNREVVIPAVFSLSADVPSHKRGLHISRLNECIEECLGSKIIGEKSLKLLCYKILKSARERCNSSHSLFCEVNFDFPYTSKTYFGMPSEETASICISSYMKGNDKREKILFKITVSVYGILACPEGQAITEYYMRKHLKKILDKKEIDNFIKSSPAGTHMERSIGTIEFETTNKPISIGFLTIIKIIESSMSSATRGILKRPDEGKTIKTVLSNPLFSEDFIKNVCISMSTQKNIQYDTNIKIFVNSLMSIHKHNIFAEKEIKLIELRKDIMNSKMHGRNK